MAGATALFAPYLPALLPGWAAAEPGLALRTVPGTLVYFDISGFTRLTERLASRGRAGAEELSDILDLVFGPLVDVAVSEGCDLLKWGGDAVLLFAPDEDGPVRAARAAFRMRTVLRKVGHLRTTVGPVVLRASSAVVTGQVVLVLGGDERLHRELIVLGPSASAVAELEGAATAGQVLLDSRTARRLEARLVGGEQGGGRLLTGLPRAPGTREPGTRGTSHQPGTPGTSREPGPGPGEHALEHLLPPQLRSHLLQGTHEPEHRVATAAFVRFSGTDALLSERGPAGLAAAVDELVRNIQDATWRHGVSFHESDIDVDGGKVMLVAGAPLSSGDDVDHMLATLRLIVDRAGEIPIRVGVAQGRVFAGDLGPHVRRAYSVKGGAVNLAARLAALAGDGEILVPAELLSHSRSQWEVLARSAQRLKGIAEPVPTVSLGSAGVEVRASDDTVMVGRGLELGRLRSALDRLGTGGGGSFEIVGEPGMGKTRLVSELVSEADDFRVLQAECAHSGAAAPYATVRTLLTDALGLRGAVDPEVGLRQVRELVGAGAPELVDRVGILGAVFDVGLGGTTTEVSSLGEEFRSDALHRLVVEVLRAVLVTPTVLVVEDTQLMDRDSSRVMTQLVARASDRPWLVVTTRRSGAQGWSPAGAEALTLGPLDAAESQSLAAVVSPDHPLTTAAAAALAERAGGHPLFLRELVLAAVRGESLDGLPLNVEELVAVQIDALAPGPRAVLRRAAVVGATFTESLLREVLADEGGGQSAGTVPGELRALTAYLAPDGANRWRFRHTVHREAAYAGLSVKVRSRLHARVGDALARSSRASGRRPEVLAHHYLAAGRFDDAWTFARQAGANAMERAAPEAAAQAYGQAAEAAARSLSVGPQERAQDLESWGDALFLCGRSAESDLAYTRARRLCLDRPLASAGLDLKLAKVAQRQGRYPVALRRTAHGLGMIAPLEGPEALAARARLLARRSFILMSLGRYAEAGTHALEAIGVAERAHEDDALARAHLVLQGVEVFTGASSADDHGSQALAIYERLGDLSGQAHAHNNVAMRLLLTGDWLAALERFQLSAASFEEVGDVANAANAAYNSADLLNRQGRSAEALAVLGTASRVARAVGDEELAALVLREEGRARVRSGARDFGMSLLAEARAQFLVLHEPHEVCETDIALAEAYLLSGRPAEARELAEAALGSAQRLGAATLLPSAVRVLACAHIDLGDLDVARVLLEDGLRVSAEPEVAHERGFLLAVAARLRAGDEQLRDAAQAALAGLGVVSPPLPWASEPARE